MKKSILILGVISLSTAILVGCNSGSTNNDDNSSPKYLPVGNYTLTVAGCTVEPFTQTMVAESNGLFCNVTTDDSPLLICSTLDLTANPCYSFNISETNGVQFKNCSSTANNTVSGDFTLTGNDTSCNGTFNIIPN